jgi:hypothetical protein
MARTTTTMENRKSISSGGGANSKQRSKLGIKNVSSGGGANSMLRVRRDQSSEVKSVSSG